MNDDASVAEEVRHLSVLIEEVISQNQAVLEIVSDNQRILAKLPTMEQDIKDLKSDMVVVKAAVTDTSKEQKLHDRRITNLEKLSHSH